MSVDRLNNYKRVVFYDNPRVVILNCMFDCFPNCHDF